ncbi:MAG: ribonuclease HI family protein [Candidatus Woesearchaeota archaeon]|nr:ribonuclease HI family protein [Nanoarchaeota archaeon]USN44393.1 MAG: ribonuclease HI family protein [Candidatus Woesearchaeota archaeon]
MTYVIYTDGASKGNPGLAGAGIFLQNKDGEEEISKFLGRKTNNEAEYLAVLFALEHLRGSSEALHFYSDSQLLVRQLNGQYKVKAPTILPLFEGIKTLMKGKDVTFTWIPREKNTRADFLANKAIERRI